MIFYIAYPVWLDYSVSPLNEELEIEVDPENWLNFCLIWKLLKILTKNLLVVFIFKLLTGNWFHILLLFQFLHFFYYFLSTELLWLWFYLFNRLSYFVTIIILSWFWFTLIFFNRCFIWFDNFIFLFFRNTIIKCHTFKIFNINLISHFFLFIFFLFTFLLFVIDNDSLCMWNLLNLFLSFEQIIWSLF